MAATTQVRILVTTYFSLHVLFLNFAFAVICTIALLRFAVMLRELDHPWHNTVGSTPTGVLMNFCF